MRIVYAVPGVLNPAEADRRRDLLRQWAAPGTEVDLVCVTEGPASIESSYEEYLSIPPTAKLMVELEKQGYDAALLGCAGDPGLDAMRELTSRMLVVGPGASSYLTAALLGNRFAVLTVEDTLLQMLYDLAHQAGCSEKLAAVRSINVPVLDLANDRPAVMDKVLAACRLLVEEDRADTLTLGCMSLGFLGVAEEITEKLGIPCVNPAKACLKMAEALVGAGLSHSKKAFATPTKLRDGRITSLDQLYVRA